MGVHTSAIVADGAEIGEDVEIGPGSIVGPRVRLGRGCRIHAHAIVEGDTHLGDHCEVFSFAAVGTLPQDKKLASDEGPGALRIGHHNKIRENATIHGGTRTGSGVTRIGNYNMLLIGCHVGHDAVIGDHVILTNGAMAAGHCEIQDHAILGAMVGVHQFTRVGAWAMVGAGSMLSHDAPPFSLVQGDRARLVAVNLVGLKRGGFTPEQSALIKRVYRVLFWRGGVLAERLENARSIAGDDPEAARLLSFVAESKRGVCVPRGRAHSGDETALLES